jgi:signal transduction histidine kinase
MTALIQFAGAVAHELNNIFTAVAGNLALLDEHLQHGSQPAEMVGEVVRTAQRGIELSAKLQAFAGRQPLKRRLTDVAQLLHDTVAGLRRTLPRSIELAFVSAPRACVSFVDQDKFREAVEELVGNALDAMGGSGMLRIEVLLPSLDANAVRGLRGRPHILVRIADSGPGMTPDVARRALDPSFSTKASHFGAGWGLSNCAGFIRQSGGAMDLKTQPGQGTCVEIYLPAETAAQGSGRRAGETARNVA